MRLIAILLAMLCHPAAADVPADVARYLAGLPVAAAGPLRDFYTCGTLDKGAILTAINPWGVVKNAFLVLDREKELEALEMA
jgi:hypothetical protein